MGNREVQGLVLGSDDKIVEGKIDYVHDVPDDLDSSNDSGRPITKSVARKLIKRHWTNITHRMNNNEVIAVYFTRERLEMLLNQTGCTGVRFYFAYKTKDDFGFDIDEGRTLVAVGANSGRYDIETDDKHYIAKGIEFDKDIIRSEDPENGIIFEMVPPLTVGNICKTTFAPEDEELVEIVMNFFKSAGKKIKTFSKKRT
ncbi:MAG: hypothetical protein HXX16_14660 [Bacteroidales bacterium]|nr:hypothetical protein [Bacteroidales bacterium]